MMKIKLILAMDKNNLVGNNDMPYGLPWHYKEDLAFYKEMTINKINVMGKNTYNAIGFALKQRETYVLSTTLNHLDDAVVVHSIDEILQLDTKEIIVAGGPTVFNSFLPIANLIYITRIDKAYLGDVYYNDLDLSDFTLIESRKGINHDLTFETWERNEDTRP